MIYLVIVSKVWQKLWSYWRWKFKFNYSWSKWCFSWKNIWIRGLPRQHYEWKLLIHLIVSPKDTLKSLGIHIPHWKSAASELNLLCRHSSGWKGKRFCLVGWREATTLFLLWFCDPFSHLSPPGSLSYGATIHGTNVSLKFKHFSKGQFYLTFTNGSHYYWH